MAGVNIPLNIYGATAWDLVKILPKVLNSDLAKAFANNPFRGPHHLDVLTGYPASKWMDLINQGVICISPPCQDRRGIWKFLNYLSHSHEDATSPMRTYNQESLLSNPTHHTTRPPVLSLQNVRGERETVQQYSYSKRPQDDQIETILTAHPRDGVYSNYNHTTLDRMSTSAGNHIGNPYRHPCSHINTPSYDQFNSSKCSPQQTRDTHSSCSQIPRVRYNDAGGQQDNFGAFQLDERRSVHERSNWDQQQSAYQDYRTPTEHLATISPANPVGISDTHVVGFKVS